MRERCTRTDSGAYEHFRLQAIGRGSRYELGAGSDNYPAELDLPIGLWMRDGEGIEYASNGFLGLRATVAGWPLFGQTLASDEAAAPLDLVDETGAPLAAINWLTIMIADPATAP